MIKIRLQFLTKKNKNKKYKPADYFSLSKCSQITVHIRHTAVDEMAEPEKMVPFFFLL